MILAICGPGRSGKDTTSEWFKNNTTLRYTGSTSEAAAKLCYEKLKDTYSYTSVEEAFAERHDHRVEWANIIWNYNKPYGTTLYEDMLKGSDILNGIRRSGEIKALQQHLLVDLTLWIDRDVPADLSCEMTAEDADIIIPNRGSIAELYQRLTRFARAAKLLR
jgi:hypothetical protein